MGLIQTSDQLRFSYQAIMKGSDQLQKENSTPTEEVTIWLNFDKTIILVYYLFKRM